MVESAGVVSIDTLICGGRVCGCLGTESRYRGCVGNPGGDLGGDGAGAGEQVLGGVAARAEGLLGVDMGEDAADESELRSLAPRQGVLMLGEDKFSL